MNKCNNDSDFIIKTIQDKLLKMVSDYVYLGSYISSSEKDFLTRKGKAWAACNAMNKIWSSDLDRNFKLKILKRLLSLFYYMGPKPGHYLKKLEKRLDGTYTRLLMRVQNISWKSHPTKVYIYNTLPPFQPSCSPEESVSLVIAAEQNKRSFLIFSCGNPFLETREDVS